MPTIEFSSVTVAFDDTVVLEDINLKLTEQRIGIIGQNGGGKSTLTRLINGLGEPSKGTVTVDHMDVAKQGITLAHAYHAPRSTGRVLSIYAGAPLPDSKEASLADAAPTSPAATETFETTSFRAVNVNDAAPRRRQWWPTLIALLVIAALIAVLIFIL